MGTLPPSDLFLGLAVFKRMSEGKGSGVKLPLQVAQDWLTGTVPERRCWCSCGGTGEQRMTTSAAWVEMENVARSLFHVSTLPLDERG